MEMLSSGAALSPWEALKSGTQDDLTKGVAASGLKIRTGEFRSFSGRFGVSNFRWNHESFRFFLIMQERERETGGRKGEGDNSLQLFLSIVKQELTLDRPRLTV